MDRRNLYKAGVNKLGNTAAKLKRKERANEDRTLRRNELFQKIRHSVAESEVQLERTTKLSKREAYLRRYDAWKAEKDKQRQEEKKNKPKPFCSAVSLSFAPKDHKFQPPVGLQKFPISRDKTIKNKQNEKEILFRKPLESVHNAIPVIKGNIKPRVSKKVRAQEPRKVNPTKLNNLRPPKIKVAVLQDKATSSIILEVKTPSEKECPQNSFITRFTSTAKKIVPADREQFCEDDIISPIENDAAECVAPPEEQSEKSAHLSTVKNNSALATLEKQPQKRSQEEYKVSTTLPDANSKIDLNVTPVCENDNKPPNYMSPFVTISRGKVSIKKEKEKRESIYKLEVSSPGEPIHVRRARESVKYFRTVLNDEIARLLARCKFWEDYRTDNLSILEECGLDMINVTIGQTKLLTSKKLEQFRELVDRCEAHVVIGSLSGSLQSVLPEDLEGFWSMVRLQVDNVDKRFENLERWKANEWCDPDETRPKTNKNISKVSKAKTKKTKPIKSNDVLKELLKKAQAAYKKNKKDNSCIDTDIIIMGKKHRSSVARSSASNTPTRRSKRIETPKRLESPKESIGAHKVTPYSRRSTLKRNSCETCTPRRATSGRPTLVMNTLYNSRARKSMNSTPRAKSRKPILKTPGTTTRNKRAVFFNDELHYKSPEVFSSEKSTSGLEEMQRSLHLRSRIVLRRDDEIDIPMDT